MDKFPLVTLHSRKVSYTGMYNLVHVFSNIRSLTCWEPMFDIADLAYLPHLKQITLIRIRYSDSMLSSASRACFLLGVSRSTSAFSCATCCFSTSMERLDSSSFVRSCDS